MTCYLRSSVDGRVSASDASESGGGVCITTGVTETGLAALKLDHVMQGSLGRDQLGLVTFGDNVGITQLAAVGEGLDFQFALAYVTVTGAELLLGVHFNSCMFVVGGLATSVATVAHIEPAFVANPARSIAMGIDTCSQRLVESMARVLPLAPMEHAGAYTRQCLGAELAPRCRLAKCGIVAA
eukprot:6221836-Amphidinium_carterae.1